MAERLVPQRLDDDLGGLDEAGARLAHIHAEAVILRPASATAKAEQAAPAAHNVELRDHLRHPHRVVPGQHDDGGAKLHPLGAACEVRQQLRRLGAHGIAGEVMLQRKDRVEAQRLGQIAHRQVVAHDSRVRPAVLLQHVQGNAYFHRFTPSTLVLSEA